MNYELMNSILQSSQKHHGIFRSQSCGTEKYHNVTPMIRGAMVVTDGVVEILEAGKCYWFTDIVASYITRIYENTLSSDNRLWCCELGKILDSNKAVFFVHAGTKEDPIITQEIPFTDIEKGIKMYLQFDGSRFVLMMPEEY